VTDADLRLSVTGDDIAAMCRHAFGDATTVDGIAEIGLGTYNSTFWVDVRDRGPAIVRIAPADEPGVTRPMRNGYAAAPYFSTLGPLVPRTLFVDFTRQLIDRDYLIQEVLRGVPAAGRLESYRNRQPYYRQLGAITRTLHAVPGPWFGPAAGPGFATWSDALADEFDSAADAYRHGGLDPHDVQLVRTALDRHRDALDAITEPRLLHGDLWRLNILLDPDAAEPAIVGIVDFDGAWWGDPYADWTIHQVRMRAGTEADAFWESYGSSPPSPIRELFYEARGIVGARLDIHRRGIDIGTVPPIHWSLAAVAARLTEDGAESSPSR
jgi:aminoglycoside phosphotransferase (APT) family kinase protein